MALHRAGQAGAEEGVHQGVHRVHAVEGEHRVEQGGYPARLVENLAGQAEGAGNGEVAGRITLQLVRADEQEDEGKGPQAVHRAGDDQAVAAVVARTGEHAHGPAGDWTEHPLHQVDRGAAGVLHEHHAGQADLFDGLPVEFAHLRGAGQLHEHCTSGRERFAAATPL